MTVLPDDYLSFEEFIKKYNSFSTHLFKIWSLKYPNLERM